MACKYKSPPYKVMKFLEESRDGWEEKAKERAIQVRDLKKDKLDLEESRGTWKTKAKDSLKIIEKLENELQKTKEALAKSQELLDKERQQSEELKKKA